MKAKSARGASTRQRILETAARLVYKNGVNGTSVDDVLAASGTGKSQFYHYFASKEALVKELIPLQVATLPPVQAQLLAHLDSREAIEGWLDQIVAAYRAGHYVEGCPIGNLASELSGQNEDLRSDLQATFAHWESCLANGLAAMIGRGELRSGTHAEPLAMFFVAAIEGALLLAKTNRSAGPLEATIGQIKAHLASVMLGASAREAVATPAPALAPNDVAPKGFKAKPKPRPLTFCP